MTKAYHEAEQSYYNQCAVDDQRHARYGQRGELWDPEAGQAPPPPAAWLEWVARGCPEGEEIPF